LCVVAIRTPDKRSQIRDYLKDRPQLFSHPFKEEKADLVNLKVYILNE